MIHVKKIRVVVSLFILVIASVTTLVSVNAEDIADNVIFEKSVCPEDSGVWQESLVVYPDEYGYVSFDIMVTTWTRCIALFSGGISSSTFLMLSRQRALPFSRS